MADEEDDIIKSAMIETEREVFGEAWGNPEGVALDETGDRSRETIGEGLEGELDDEDEDEDEEGDDEDEGEEGEPKPDDGKPKPGEPKPPKLEEPEGKVPPGRLRTQTERTRAAEAERDALRGQFEAMQAENRKLAESHAQTQALIQQLLQRQQPQPGPQQPQQPQQPQGPPDMYEDPQGYAAYVQHLASAENRALRAEMDANRVNSSMENARTIHKDAFDSAYSTLTGLDPKNPDNRELVRRIYSSPNPGEAMVQWHRRNETLRRVGNDPQAYEARVREDARKQLMADPEFQRELLEGLRGQAVAGGRNETRLPPSLNRANGGNSRAPNDLSIYDGSDTSIFASAFNN